MIVLGLNCFHGDSWRRSFAMANWSRQRKRSASAASSTGRAFLRRRSHIVWLRPASRCPTSITSRSIRIAAPIFGKLHYILAQRPDPRLVWSRWKNRRRASGVASCWAARSWRRIRWTVHAVEHHLAHLSSAFHVSPFERGGRGFGRWIRRFRERGMGRRRGHRDSGRGRVYFPHSLGIFYQALTQYLGFPHYGDEYKVMGLAPYGRPPSWRHAPDRAACGPMAHTRSICAIFRHHQRAISYEWDDGARRSAICFRRRWRNCWARAASPRIRSTSATGTSPARCRRCTRRRFSIC